MATLIHQPRHHEAHTVLEAPGCSLTPLEMFVSFTSSCPRLPLSGEGARPPGGAGVLCLLFERFEDFGILSFVFIVVKHVTTSLFCCLGNLQASQVSPPLRHISVTSEVFLTK